MGIPILVTQIVLPLIVFLVLLLNKRKHSIEKEKLSSFSKNFSYFYMDYSSDCYYWEFIRMFQRFLIILFLILF
jgi:hypothetical protein